MKSFSFNKTKYLNKTLLKRSRPLGNTCKNSEKTFCCRLFLRAKLRLNSSKKFTFKCYFNICQTFDPNIWPKFLLFYCILYGLVSSALCYFCVIDDWLDFEGFTVSSFLYFQDSQQDLSTNASANHEEDMTLSATQITRVQKSCNHKIGRENQNACPWRDRKVCCARGTPAVKYATDLLKAWGSGDAVVIEPSGNVSNYAAVSSILRKNKITQNNLNKEGNFFIHV